jgi:hypothetical protein
MYKLIIHSVSNKPYMVQREDGAFIPFDPANTDYQAYLKYKEEGGKVYGPDEEVPSGQTSK